MNQALDTGKVRQMVDDIIVPGYAESQFRSFASLLNYIAEADESERKQLAEIASAHAYTHTQDFADRYREFVGWLPEATHETPLVHHDQTVS